MKTQYDVDEWAEETTVGRHVFNFHYRLRGDELPNWQLLKMVTMQSAPGVTEDVYLWQGGKERAGDMIRVSISEHDHWRRAQQQLRDELDDSMRPEIPKGTRNLANLGDVSFVARDPHSDAPAAISFTRGNVSVSVRSVGERNIDVSEIATKLDRALTEPPTKAFVERGLAREQKPTTVTLQPNRASVVIKDLHKSAPRGSWLKVIAPDGELSRSGDELVYVSSEPGQKVVSRYVVPAERP